ncbi:MAG: nucleotidyltransferase family protein, partial [bacterium]
AERTLAALAAAFAAARLPFFVVKGSVLAHQVYDDPHWRRFADLDAVVGLADVPRAEVALAPLGYRSGADVQLLAAAPASDAERAMAIALSRRFEMRRLAALNLPAPPGGELLSVDLHWRVTPTRLRVGEAQLWEQTVPLRIAGTTVLTFTPAATLIHLAAHATTCLLNGFRLLHLVDVAWAATRFADHAAATWRLADEWRVAAHLALVLDTAQRMLQIDLPLAGARRPSRRPRPWVDVATREAFLLDAATLPQRSAAVRLWRELVWSVAMGCLRRNVAVVAAAVWVRARFRFFRWRQHPAD